MIFYFLDVPVYVHNLIILMCTYSCILLIVIDTEAINNLLLIKAHLHQRNNCLHTNIQSIQMLFKQHNKWYFMWSILNVTIKN